MGKHSTNERGFRDVLEKAGTAGQALLNHTALPGTEQAKWPAALRITLGIVFSSPAPIALLWDEEQLFFANDAALSLLGVAASVLGKPLTTLDEELQHWASQASCPNISLANGNTQNDLCKPAYKAAPVYDEEGNVAGTLFHLASLAEPMLQQSIGAPDIHHVIEIAPVPAVLYRGEELWIELANAEVLKLWGRDKSVIGQRLIDAMPELRTQPFIQLLKDVYHTGKTFEGKDIPAWVDNNGRIEMTYFDLIYKAVRKSNGEIYGVLAMGYDVTAQVLGRKQVEDSEMRFRNTVLQAPVGITILKGNDFIVDLANEAYLALVDRPEKDFVGKPLFEVLPEVEPFVKPLLRNVLRTGEPAFGVEFEVPLKRHGKIETTFFNFVYQPMRETDGFISGIIVIATEVTRQVEAKRELESTAREFRHIVRQSPIAMTVLRGPSFIIEMANETMLHTIWRKKEAEVMGRPILEVFPELLNQPYPRLLEYVYTTGVTHRQKEAVADVIGDDGLKRFYLDFEYSPNVTPDNEISGIMITVHDVTEKVEAQQRIRDAEERLRFAVHASELGTFELDFITREFNSSERFLRIMGFSESDQPAHAEILAKIAAEDMQVRDTAMQLALQTGTLEYEIRINATPGVKTWIRVKGKIIYDDAGQPLKLSGGIMDITHEKLAHRLTEESERKLQDLANSMPQLVWISEPDGGVIYYNDRVAEYSAVMVDGHWDWVPIIFEEDMANTSAEWASASAEKRPYTIEHRLRMADGSLRWHLTRAFPQFDASGNITRWYGTATDIHSVKSIEERTIGILDSITAHIAVLNREGVIIAVNRSWNRFGDENGASALESAWVGQNYLEVLRNSAGQYSEEAPVVLAGIHAVINGEIPHFSLEYPCHSPTRNRWFLLHVSLLRYDNGGVVVSHTDITDRRLSEEAMKKSEEKFRSLSNSVPQHVWTADGNGSINFYNQSVFEFSGLTMEQLQGDGWGHIIHPDDLEENIKRWKKSVGEGVPFLYEHRFRRNDGEYRWHLSRALPQFDEQGNVQMWVGTSTDIDDIKRHEQQKDDFIKMASHELKTPVTSIKGYIQLLQKIYHGTAHGTLNNYLGTIDKQVQKLTKLITDLLDVTRIETGSLQLSPQPFDMHDLAASVVQDLQHASPTHRITLQTTGPAPVLADQDRVSQVLINYITNAIKYSPAADSVIVKVDRQSSEVIVSVQDFGIGIAPAEFQRIFERFYRAQGKEEQTYSGFGIGLFIVQEIISRHNGRTWVESEKDRGSIFYFSLPVSLS